MKVFKFAVGLGVGYVLGSRAGRDKYEQIVAAARKAQDHPVVTRAQDKVKQVLGTATDKPVVDTEPVIVVTPPPPPTTTSADPVPRPPRRKSPLAGAVTTTDPLTP